ncbi:MAG: VWA domain-containing protein, partial [Gammaproteobacteria bacterium]|nr:VWA domain-containing protein [Gammaproteobacteria bacterium]
MGELLSAFHFSEPAWLWALLLCVPVALWLYISRNLASGNERIRRYADAYLLPHLLGKAEASTRTQWLRYARWTGVWTLLVLAMAGPRWDFTDVQLFRPGTNLLVLFDISRSMNVADVKPNRLARARQEVEDLLGQSRGIRVGLIGFASVAHVVSPVTEDLNGIRRLLSALDTSLVQLQGSRLLFALERAQELLLGQPVDSVNSLLIITDGDFDEPGLEQRLQEFADIGVRVHVLGV